VYIKNKLARSFKDNPSNTIILRGCPKLHWTSADSPLVAGFPCPQYHKIHGYSMYGMIW